jgi:hypothetical protein
MGQYDRGKRELDAATIARATYVPDLRERAFQDAGSFLAAREAGVVDDDHVHAELGEVVAGHSPGRTSSDEVTVFDSGGTGIETVAAAWMLYERAKAEGLGETIEFEFPFELIYRKEACFTGHTVPIYREGEFDGAILTATDISERTQNERNLKRQREQLAALDELGGHRTVHPRRNRACGV